MHRRLNELTIEYDVRWPPQPLLHSQCIYATDHRTMFVCSFICLRLLLDAHLLHHLLMLNSISTVLFHFSVSFVFPPSAGLFGFPLQLVCVIDLKIVNQIHIMQYPKNPSKLIDNIFDMENCFH